jgi:hypothetical protein
LQRELSPYLPPEQLLQKFSSLSSDKQQTKYFFDLPDEQQAQLFSLLSEEQQCRLLANRQPQLRRKLFRSLSFNQRIQLYLSLPICLRQELSPYLLSDQQARLPNATPLQGQSTTISPVMPVDVAALGSIPSDTASHADMLPGSPDSKRGQLLISFSEPLFLLIGVHLAPLAGNEILPN